MGCAAEDELIGIDISKIRTYFIRLSETCEHATATANWNRMKATIPNGTCRAEVAADS